jgi:hypothetical protein
MRRLLLASLACLLMAIPAVGQSNIGNARLQERPEGTSRRSQQLQPNRAAGLLTGARPISDWNACCWDSGARSCCSQCRWKGARWTHPPA